MQAFFLYQFSPTLQYEPLMNGEGNIYQINLGLTSAPSQCVTKCNLNQVIYTSAPNITCSLYH